MYLVKSLPFGSKVKVTNKKNGHAVTVTITDRGPYVKGRCIDLSKAGAGALGFAGLAPVSVVPVVSDSVKRENGQRDQVPGSAAQHFRYLHRTSG
jgi:rare lipoprotein A